MDDYFVEAGFPRPDFVDVGGWAMEVITNPERAFATAHDGTTVAAPTMTLRTVADLGRYWNKVSSTYSTSLAQAAVTPQTINVTVSSGEAAVVNRATAIVPALTSEFARKQYGIDAAKPFSVMFPLLLRRQLMFARRNILYIAARLVLTIGMVSYWPQ
jgi:hypothetical protein